MMLRTIISLSLLLGSAHAAEQFQPANFHVADTDKRLQNTIKFPDVSGKVNGAALCFTTVSVSGRMQDVLCAGKDQYHRAYAEAAVKGSKRARMNPALVDGKKRRVYIQFRAYFTGDEDNRSIKLLLNPGTVENIEAYGEEHIAGQRLLTNNSTWRKTCPKRTPFLLNVRAHLSMEGRADSVSIEHVKGLRPTIDCFNAIEQEILNSRFIPAMVDGEAVPSSYVELFGS